MRQLVLLRYAKRHWRGLATLLLTMLMGIGLEVLRPWPMKVLVDNVLGGRQAPDWLLDAASVVPGSTAESALLVLMCAGTVFVYLGVALVTMWGTFLGVRVGQRMTYDLAGDLFLHLQRLSVNFHNRRSVGDVVARVTGDATCVQTLVNGALVPIIQSVVTLVVMFAIMWRLEPTMTLLSLSVIPFMFVVIRTFGGSMKRQSRVKRDLEGQMMGVVQQSLNAVPAIQAFTREETEHARFRSYADQTARAYERVTSTQMRFKLFAGLCTALGTAGLMYVGGRYALDQKITVGTILVFLSYLSAMYVPLNSLAFMASTVQSAAASADRVLEILDTVPEVRDVPGAREAPHSGEVRFENVTFGYLEDQPPVLEGITLEARPGQVVAIVGPTGAGKSTLVSLLVRFFDPWNGRVTLDGHDLRELRVRSVRERVAMVLQEPFIFPLTVAENIAYGRPDASREDIVAAAVNANADEFIRRLPDGYDTVVGERGATLSGGEKQRLSIARAFLKDAPILILDEPTSALDARTEGMLLDALDRLMKGRITLVIAHRLSTIRQADQILVLDRGRIIERGDHVDLLAADGLYAGLYQRQMDQASHDAEPAPVMADFDDWQPPTRRFSRAVLAGVETWRAAGTGNGNGNGDGHR